MSACVMVNAKKLYACMIQARAITDASKPPGIYAPSSNIVI